MFVGLLHPAGRSLGPRAGKLLHGLPQIFMWIHRSVADAYLVVEMRSGATAARSHVADDLSAGHLLAFGDRKAGEMSVDCFDPISVINHDLTSVPGGAVGHFHGPVRGGAHRRSKTGGDVNSGMEGALTVEGVLPLAKGAGNGTDDRPQRGSIGQCQSIVQSKGTAHIQAALIDLAGKGRAAQRIKLVKRLRVGLFAEIV